MANKLKLILVAGARPNFMKIAPLIHAIGRHNAARNGAAAIDFCLVHTGQHYDAGMSKVFFDELGIPEPNANLEVGSGSHAVQTANVMTRFEPLCQKEKPDWIVVVGDVNSTMACTLVGAKLGVRVAHVEAGLRSFDRSMPEEINRLVTDALADLLLTPSVDGNENLRREGVPESKIKLVGNIMIDSLVSQLAKAESAGTLDRLGLKKNGYLYVTLHRPANVDAEGPLRTIVQELAAVAHQWPVVFPIHPRTRNRLTEFGMRLEDHPGVKLLEPIGYLDSLMLTRHARCVLTDSGGLQEESTYFRTPCLTLRPNTERPITVTLGSNRLITPAQLSASLENVLSGPERFGAIPPNWDGHTAERVLDALLTA